SVLPRVKARALDGEAHFIRTDSSYHSPELYVNTHVLQFGDARLMVYDGEKTYRGNLNVDLLLVRNNPRIPISQLLEKVKCKQLILDGSNYDSTIKRLMMEAQGVNIPVYVLKNNFAY